MAAEPIYGGTEGVSVLDIGQPGGTREGANTARWIGRASQDASDSISTHQKLPQQVAGFMDVQGPGGPEWQWVGKLRVSVMSVWFGSNGIRSDIEEHIHGHPLGATGAYGAFSDTEIKPTALTDSFGNTVAAKAKLVRYTVGPVFKVTGDPNMNFLFDLSLIFKVIR